MDTNGASAHLVAAEELRRRIRDYEAQMANLQGDADCLRHALAIMLRGEASGQAMLPEPLPTSYHSPEGAKTTKHQRLAVALSRLACNNDTGFISSAEAMNHLMANGLTTEKSKRFHTWHALNKTNMFVRVGRGKYRVADSSTDGPDDGLQLFQEQVDGNGVG